MVCNSRKRLFYFSVIIISIICFGCNQNNKPNIQNTFYIELVNFNFDSLQSSLSNGLFGKISFYKNKKLEVVSSNYIIDNMMDLHYYFGINEKQQVSSEGAKKIKIELVGQFSYDSVNYSLQKFIFKQNRWQKISDMGVLKNTSSLVRPKNKLADLTEQIINNTVDYSYN